MFRNKISAIVAALCLSASGVITSWADTAQGITMENCGAYLFTWRPVDCGNGRYFAIISGGDTIKESDVVLNRGYDYAYTFDYTRPKPWGTVPDLAYVDGKWGIPENWSSMPEGSYPTLQIVLTTNNRNFSFKERYIDVVKLPSNVSKAELPDNVRKYLINVDGSDAGANNTSVSNGWIKNEDGTYRYRKPDGTFVSNSWLKVDEHSYYMNQDGIMLTDTITPDGIYVNTKGEKTNYIPGWKQNEKGWQYVLKSGSYAANTWIQDTDGKWYYFNIGTYMLTDTTTPDGFYVDSSGCWDGQPSLIDNSKSLGPAFAQ